MKLLVVSHTPHHRRDDGTIVGWGPTVRELDHLSSLFGELVHVAPLHPGDPSSSSLPYVSRRVRLAPIEPSGGDGWRAKAEILTGAPKALAVVAREERTADVVHVRTPANIALLTLWRRSLGLARRRPWWVKYAGNWSPSGRPGECDYLSYRLQRGWLRRRRRRLAVTVNGCWPNDPRHVVSFRNPCLSIDELRAARRAASEKFPSGERLLRLLFVGHLLPEKGALRAVEALARIRARAVLEIVGDGPERAACEAAARRLGVADRIILHGWLPRPELAGPYGQAHLLIAPSASNEGWPKILSEAMASGVVPVAGDVSCIAAELEAFGCGVALPPLDVQGFASAIDAYAEDPDRWRRESAAAVEAARRFTYPAWLEDVRTLFHEHLGIDLPPVAEPVLGPVLGPVLEPEGFD